MIRSVSAKRHTGLIIAKLIVGGVPNKNELVVQNPQDVNNLYLVLKKKVPLAEFTLIKKCIYL